MRQWIALAGRMYPRQWRARYGAEFDALLEDVQPGWRQFADVLKGAVQMQIKSPSMYWKTAGALAVAGAIVALAVSFAMPRQYESSAVLRFSPAQNDPNHAVHRLNQMNQQILSRGSLTELIQRPALDLYRVERRRLPMEDVVAQMRRDTKIRMISSAREGTARAWTISFTYSDELKAQAVVRELVRKFVERNVSFNRMRDEMWQSTWHESPPAVTNVEVLDPPTLPTSASEPNRTKFLLAGLGGGSLLGLAAVLLLRRPRWVLPVAACAAAGCALALAIPAFLPQRYVSSALMRFTPPQAPARVTGEITTTAATERWQNMSREILSRSSLAEVIQNPKLHLYQKERATMPMEDVVNLMRKDISFRMLDMGRGSRITTPAFIIQFSYPDRFKAQAVVRELIAKFMYQNNIVEGEQAKTATPEVRAMLDRKMGVNLELLDPPSDPLKPAGPSRMSLGAAGLTAGLLLGALAVWIRQRRNHSPAQLA